MPGSDGFSFLTTRLRATLAAHGYSKKTGIPVGEVLERREDLALKRRTLLKAGVTVTAAGAVSVAARPAFGATAPAKPTNPSVIVVGAGLAGLRAAHWLYKVKGITSTVYEANTRAGGRCYTLRGFFDDGITVEHGGALINTDHTAVRNLAASLHLDTYLVNGGNQPPGGDTYWIDGARYPYDQANADWGTVYSAMTAALRAAPFCQTWDSQIPSGVALDNMTVNQWLDANVPGGLSSRFAKLMQSNAVVEYGLDPDQQSALNLIYLLGWNSQNSLSPINGSDEKYSIAGGNDQLISAMIADLPAGTIQYGQQLVAVTANANASVTCSFQSGHKVTDVTADRVILALPFTTLRDCDLSRSGFSAVKLQTIAQQGLGANAKIHVQFNSRPWVAQGAGGVAYTNVAGFQCAWDDTVNQATTKGVLCEFTGGSQVINGWNGAAFGSAPANQVSAFLSQLEPIFPGATAAYSGKAYRDLWLMNPWTKGAYTCQKPGQYTTIFGNGAVPEGNVHFAGEHTSVNFFGYLNGAVESGERAAKEIAGP